MDINQPLNDRCPPTSFVQLCNEFVRIKVNWETGSRLLLKISSRKILFDSTLSDFQIYHEKVPKSDFSLSTAKIVFEIYSLIISAYENLLNEAQFLMTLLKVSKNRKKNYRTGF